MTKYFNNFSLRFLTVFTIIGNLNDNFVSIYCSFGAFDWNKNILCQLLVIRYHKSEVLTALISSDNLMQTSGYNFYNSAFPAFSGLLRIYCNRYSVHMHGSVGILLRDIDIFLFTLYRHKAKASAVSGINTG